MGFHGILAGVKLFGDFPCAQALGDQLEDVEFAAGDAKVFAFLLVEDEGPRGWRRHFLEDDALVDFGELEAEPDAKSGKSRRRQRTVDFDGMVDDQEALLAQLEDEHQRSANYATGQDVPLQGFESTKIHQELESYPTNNDLSAVNRGSFQNVLRNRLAHHMSTSDAEQGNCRPELC